VLIGRIYLIRTRNEKILPPPTERRYPDYAPLRQTLTGSPSPDRRMLVV
jgi:hypothetical protein